MYLVEEKIYICDRFLTTIPVKSLYNLIISDVKDCDIKLYRNAGYLVFLLYIY